MTWEPSVTRAAGRGSCHGVVDQGVGLQRELRFQSAGGEHDVTNEPKKGHDRGLLGPSC